MEFTASEFVKQVHIPYVTYVDVKKRKLISLLTLFIAITWEIYETKLST